MDQHRSMLKNHNPATEIQEFSGVQIITLINSGIYKQMQRVNGEHT